MPSSTTATQDMELANGGRITVRGTNIRVWTPVRSMTAYVTSRVPSDAGRIEVRRYTPNSGQNAWGLIWP